MKPAVARVLVCGDAPRLAAALPASLAIDRCDALDAAPERLITSPADAIVVMTTRSHRG